MDTNPANSAQRYSIYVYSDTNMEKAQLHGYVSSLDEARKQIMYERDEDDIDTSAVCQILWGNYASRFNWLVVDTLTHEKYNYNIKTRQLLTLTC